MNSSNESTRNSEQRQYRVFLKPSGDWSLEPGDGTHYEPEVFFMAGGAIGIETSKYVCTKHFEEWEDEEDPKYYNGNDKLQCALSAMQHVSEAMSESTQTWLASSIYQLINTAILKNAEVNIEGWTSHGQSSTLQQCKTRLSVVLRRMQ